MQRVKLFESAHKGLRNALSQFSYMIGKTDFNNHGDVKSLHSLGLDVCMLLGSHANDENTIVLAELEAKVPGSSKHDMDDHERLEVDQDAIERLLDDIKTVQGNGEDAAGMGAELYIKFAKFHGEYLLHTVEEETVTQRMLWENFTDAEIHGMRGRIIARFTPEAFEKWQGFILPAITNNDRAMMFGGLKANAPEQFAKMMIMAEKFLPAEDLEKLKESLK